MGALGGLFAPVLRLLGRVLAYSGRYRWAARVGIFLALCYVISAAGRADADSGPGPVPVGISSNGAFGLTDGAAARVAFFAGIAVALGIAVVGIALVLGMLLDATAGHWLRDRRLAVGGAPGRLDARDRAGAAGGRRVPRRAERGTADRQHRSAGLSRG